MSLRGAFEMAGNHDQITRTLVLRFFGVITFILVIGCASSRFEVAPSLLDLEDFYQFKLSIGQKKPTLDSFMVEGPCPISIKRNFKIRVTNKVLLITDLYMSKLPGKAPLVIIQHGNLANKKVHALQARQLASWGIHALVVEQINENHWIKNGQNIYKLVRLLKSWPHIIGEQFDKDNITLSGHSFGGSAMAIAAGKRPAVNGLILLDPALYNTSVKAYISRIETPTIILGADENIFMSKNRKSFFNLIGKETLEVSVKGATHNDAQYPDLFSLPQMLWLEASTSEDRQKLFAAAMVASAYSFYFKEDTSFALTAFKVALDQGVMKDLQKK